MYACVRVYVKGRMRLFINKLKKKGAFLRIYVTFFLLRIVF